MILRWPQFVTAAQREPVRLFRLRLFVGSIVIYREAFVALGLSAAPRPENALGHPYFFILLGLFLLCGFFTRLSYLLLAVSYVTYNLSYGLMNLGPLFLVPLCWCGFILDRRPLRSLDALSATRSPAAARLLLWGNPPGLDTYNFVYGILFLIYSVDSFAAILFHLNDPYWMSGHTVRALFVNNYLSTFFEQFRAIEAWNESFARAFSIFSGVAQTIFQLFMFPLAYSRWGRWYVVLHGFAFFFISLFFIQISILPLIEIAWWLLLFGPWIAEWRTMPCVTRIKPNRLRQAAEAFFAVASFAIILNTSLSAFRTGKILFENPLRIALMNVGLWPPNVFNNSDLQMGQTWFVLERVLPDGRFERVPVFAENGARLHYHLSDFVYFGYTLGWRRNSIVAKWPSPESDKLLEKIGQLAEMDRKFRGLTGPQKYVARVMRDHSMNLSLSREERYKVEPIVTKEYELE